MGRCVVFDTNILVSALVFPGGQGEAALRRIIDQADQLVLSRPIVDVLLDVLSSKFARDAEELAHVAVFITELATAVAPKRRLHVVKDEPDNRIPQHPASSNGVDCASRQGGIDGTYPLRESSTITATESGP